MCKTLIVEDSATFRKAFREALNKRFPDMLIEEAKDGLLAFQKIKAIQPDIVFMDIRLPGENGLTLTGKIKDNYPDTKVIILTDYDLPEYRAAAFDNGADNFIAKGSLNLGEIADIIDLIAAEA
ncbi:Signal transduction response regulator, receiver domain-containing protein [Desulfonema limicola]|uniref:Signal transduction response regulator, receiver domain-containing protein n=1 Tax=Desulfonema limicola TaxID=45656 RepID=A0A975GJM5_9BACT|nr:response regulator transcription factor [Desulfonema limicola]QTA83637.1 Signal transduction response regulator, receiver domain-containing protein [Desulfonema limicola]